jgi:DNA modification methylase
MNRLERKEMKDIEINKIYNFDCIEFMKLLTDNNLDLVIADPPYFRILKKQNWDKFKNVEQYMIWSEEYLKLVVSKLRLNGTLILFGCTRNFNILSQLDLILESNGMEFIEEIILDKGIKSVAGRTNPDIKMLPPVTENILVYRKDAKPFVKSLLKQKQIESHKTSKEMNEILGCKSNGGGNWTKYCGNTEFSLFPTEEHWNRLREVFNIDINYKDIAVTYNPIRGLTNVWNDINFYIKNRKHPSEKPVQLSERYIQIFSNENDLIYIPFAGSGSEIESCINNHRNWIATEINKDYIDNIIIPRIEKLY